MLVKGHCSEESPGTPVPTTASTQRVCALNQASAEGYFTLGSCQGEEGVISDRSPVDPSLGFLRNLAWERSGGLEAPEGGKG